MAPLTAKEQKRIDEAVQLGLDGLRRSQLESGSFGDGIPGPFAGPGGRWWPVGYAALPGLALLECGIAAADPGIQKAARFVRNNAPTLNRTYEISLSLLFLHRLGEAEDRPLIRSLALRLAASQSSLGGWGYTCAPLTAAQEKKLLEVLRERKPDDIPKKLTFPDPKGRNEVADNSNTQFAILALSAARKHDLPLDYTLARAEQRFRVAQQATGWSYQLHSRGGRSHGAMTCAGLLALAVGRGSAADGAKPDAKADESKGEDPAIAWGLHALGIYLNDPSDAGSNAGLGPKGKLNLYFLWSVERVGVLCKLKTIGGKDWYRWGVDLLLTTQNPDGSWSGRGNGPTCAVIDTSMALLFLKRSDLLPDLRETLQKRLTITDPGPPIDPKSKKKTPETPSAKETDDALLAVNLGDLKATTLNVSGSLTSYGGTVGGAPVSDSIYGNLTNNGGVAFSGTSLHTLYIYKFGGTTGGNYTQNSGANLVMNLDNGAANDTLSVAATATLGGTLTLDGVNTLTGNQVWTLIVMGARSGNFGSISWPDANPNWAVLNLLPYKVGN